MLTALCFLALIIGYWYSLRKTKQLLRQPAEELATPQKKYSLMLIALYAIFVFVLLVCLGHLLASQVIKYSLGNTAALQHLNPVAVLSVQETLHHLPLVLKAHPGLTGIGPVSFYINNQDLLNIYDHYTRMRCITNLSIFLLFFITGMLILRRIMHKIAPKGQFQQRFEILIRRFLMLCTAVTIFVSIAIVTSLLWESILFFHSVSIFNFLFGTQWTPQNYELDPNHSFSILPLLAGTFLIAIIAIIVALIIALPVAMFMSEFMTSSVKSIIKPILEVLSGIPTIVYGFFAALVLGPTLVHLLAHFGITIQSESAIVAGLIIGIMIVPFISSAADDVLTSMPRSIREGAYALGCMPYEVMLRVLLPAAFPGILSSILLAFSRAIGETMVVVMASGLFANLTLNPFASVTTITTQIVTTVQGDQDFASPKTLVLFALGFTLFCITLLLNLISFWVIKRYKQKF